MTKAYLGIGSNIGNTKKNIDESIDLLKNNPHITVTNVSSYYETEPVGYKNQDWFLNVVVEIDTSLDPYKLLSFCNQIEEQLKRKRLMRWGPRTIDVDILLYEGFLSTDEQLIVPHPRMCQRAFVIIPLYEISKDLIINGINIEDIIKNLNGEEVRKVNYER